MKDTIKETGKKVADKVISQIDKISEKNKEDVLSNNNDSNSNNKTTKTNKNSNNQKIKTNISNSIILKNNTNNSDTLVSKNLSLSNDLFVDNKKNVIAPEKNFKLPVDSFKPKISTGAFKNNMRYFRKPFLGSRILGNRFIRM
ncbi:hypothetical protein [Candidatus Phytoplasma palmae]|uniref:hypothetical protein n=1 Tax=Candidatus Phytoplasma palmae TaxID=85624 RepID=UPI003990823C